MSHSRIFDEYAKIMSEKGLFKTAEKKDSDYNVVPEKAGPDTKVDKTGYELVEIAHPEQIQVAESRLNDGIVENGVERQKAMVDVALRNPRGVLASLMQTLVKAATILDADMNDESIKMASEIDLILAKLAQQSPTFPIKPFNDLVNAATKAAEAIKNFDFEGFFHKYFWFKSDLTKQAQEFAAQIWEYKTAADGAFDDTDKIKVAQELAQYGLQRVPQFRRAFQMEGEEWFESNRTAAWDSLNEFERQAKWWLGKVVPALGKPIVPAEGPASPKPTPEGEYHIPAGMVPMQGKPGAGEVRVIDRPDIQWDGEKWNPSPPPADAQIIGMPGTKMEKARWDKRLGLWLVPGVGAEQQVPGMASKAPKGHKGGGYSIKSPDVEQLQGLLGGSLDVDGKFGPLTWKAVMQAAAKNSLLNELMKGKPELSQGYQHWTNADVGQAVQRIQQASESAKKAQPQTK